jgi:hypothetical protein
MKMATRFALAALAATTLAAPGSLEIVLSPKPQSYPNTCQSYALAFVFARADVPGFETDSVAALRSAELRIRMALEAAGDPYAHTTWIAATKVLTKGSFTLERREFTDPETFMRFLGQTTGVENADSLGLVVSSLVVRTPVLTSFTSIANSQYAGGHIVAVLGVAGRPNIQRRLMLLNPAIKTPSVSRLACQTDDLPGDSRYQAAAALTDEYTLNTYSGRYVALWLRR